MSPDEKQVLIEKIDGLSPEQRKRVEGYVDALLERQVRGATKRSQNADSGESGTPKSTRRVSAEEEAAQENDPQDSQERVLRQDWAGALSDLKDEYTSLELEEKIKKQ